MKAPFWRALALMAALGVAVPLPAAPASNQRVGGGMLMGVGLTLGVLGVGALATPPDGLIRIDPAVYGGIAAGGFALAGLGAWLWVRGDPAPQAGLSLRY